jgi:beta-ureidopropionase / N-carbamoyl-L-amino-acid hydrolase
VNATATVLARLVELAHLGAWDGGIDRALFSLADRAARERFAAWAGDAGLGLCQDRSGNTFARRPGAPGRAPILFGSHLDTVRTGGPYDGAYGVVAALGAIELLTARGIATEHPLEAVAWAGEEGSRFPLGCLGSGAFARLNEQAAIDALCDADGVTFAAARDGATGLLPGIAMRPEEQPAAYLELHVEQGPVLERAGARLGVVTAIAGQARHVVVVSGESGHAGTVPMAGRSDALVATAELVAALDAAVRELGDAVLTVGKLDVEPNQTNVIPAQVTFRTDARSVEDARIDALTGRLHELAAAAEVRRGVRIRIALLERRAAVAMDPALRACVRRAAVTLDARAPDLPSGAGHDAMCVATIAPAAMLFVPSIGGQSHVAGERTAPADLELGVEALARALVEVDRAVR